MYSPRDLDTSQLRSDLAALKTYIANQKQHHRRITFEEELIALLKKYNIPYDERYVFG